jgi:2-polyprenyl-3-methyl-5-hydroxy-6-metoxy-1,4-benzoquinol methylase
MSVWRAIKKYALQSFRTRAVMRRNVRLLAARLGDLEARSDAEQAPHLRYPGCPQSDQPFSQLTSSLCRQADFSSAAYHAWCSRFGQRRKWHRKQWEYFFILQSLYERGKLAPGQRGLGFGVGREPLVSVMAALGAEALATDMSLSGAKSQGWVSSGQFAAQLADLNAGKHCPPDEFERRVTYREVDMNAIPADIGEFDFIWSSCAFEHLGTLRHGAQFVINSSKHLKPGGVGVHTTEYNLSSNDVTISAGHTSLYRKRDLEELEAELLTHGCELVPLSLDAGSGFLDQWVDVPPFLDHVHLRRQLEEFSVTSVGLIVVKK